MCVVSNMGDMGQGMWPKPWTFPIVPGDPPPNTPLPTLPMTFPSAPAGPTREQFLKFLELLRVAREFDALTGQPNCEQAVKVAWIRDLARHLGVDQSEVDRALA